MRKFELISKEQWDKDVPEHRMDSVVLPTRATKNSAGYDFTIPCGVTIEPNDTAKIPTGIKAAMEDNEVLMIYPRSSLGFKTNVRLANTVGVVDSSYYNNMDNEGHIWIKLYNPTNITVAIAEGERFAQCIFTSYLTVDDETEVTKERTGGLGSTGK